MITKEITRRIEEEMLTVNSPDSKEIEQFEALLRVGAYLLRADVNLIDFTQNLWDNSGVGAAILTTPNGSAVEGGKYDAAYIRKVQVLFWSLKQWLATPLTVVAMGNTISLTETPRQLIMMAPKVIQPEPTQQGMILP